MTYPVTPLDFDEYVRLAELHDWTHVELDDGMVIEMSPESGHHAMGSHDLLFPLAHHFGEDRVFGPATLVLDERNALEPDLFVVRAGTRETRPDWFRTAHIEIVVEVAISSLSRDLVVKSRKYARADIAEYWVVASAKGVLHRHTHPTPDGYLSVIAVPIAPIGTYLDVAAILAAGPPDIPAVG